VGARGIVAPTPWTRTNWRAVISRRAFPLVNKNADGIT